MSKSKESSERDQEITLALIKCFYLYPNYRVDSRGPSGLILSVLDRTSPQMAKRIRDGEDSADLCHELERTLYGSCITDEFGDARGSAGVIDPPR